MSSDAMEYRRQGFSSPLLGTLSELQSNSMKATLVALASFRAGSRSKDVLPF